MTRFLPIAPLLLTCLVTGRSAIGQVGPPVVDVPEHDAELLAAEKRAMDELPRFIAAASDPQEGQEMFSIKVAFVDGELTEYIWLGKVTYAKGKFTGVVDNEPRGVKNVKYGDRRTVAKEAVSDWLYMDKGKLRGGYSLKLLMKRMREQNRR